MILVIKYFEQFALKVPGIPDAYPQWGLVMVRQNKSGGTVKLKQVTREEAMKEIRENGLVEMFRKPRLGVVFDTPDGAFKKKFGKVSVPYNLGAE